MDNEFLIKSILRQLGVGQSYQGYEYVIYGIQLVLQDKKRLEFVTKSLYPDIAVKYHTSWKCVERNIRTVIDVAWKEGDPGLILEICNGKNTSRPHNSQFFEMMYEYMNRFYGEHAAALAEPYLSVCSDSCFCQETGKPCARLLTLQRQIEELQMRSGISGEKI